MKTLLTSVFLFLVLNTAKAQVQDSLITIEFNDITRPEALNQLSETTDYQIYYHPSWFSTAVVQRKYHQKHIRSILEDLLKGTTLNFFNYSDTAIILTNNNVIYDKLPDDFFANEKEVAVSSEINETAAPVFYSSSEKPANKKPEVHRVGKESRSNYRSRHLLTGTLTNQESGDPIPDMTILSEDNKLLGVTDFNGSYSIQLPAGSNILSFRALGFERAKKEIIIFSDGVLNLSFYENVEQLEEIVLEGDTYSNIEEVSGGSEEVGSEESKTVPLVLGERDVMKVATALPGISTAGEGATGFNVRGGRSDQNLILLDGATIYNPQHFFGIFSAINPFSIGALNVYKGNIPPKYGGRLSSVFEMQTRERDHTSLQGEASIGPVTGNIVLDIPVVKEKSSLMVGGRGAYANWILRQLDDEALKNSSASFYDGIINYSHDINANDRLKATAYYSNDNFSISSDSLFIYNNRLLSLRWQHRFNDKNVGEVQLTNSNYGFNIEYERGANNDFRLGYNINESTAKLNFNYLHSSKWSLNYGLEGKWYSSEPGNISPLNSSSSVQSSSIQEENALEAAGFASLNYELSKRIAIDAGVRYSSFSALGERTQFQYREDLPLNEGNITDTLEYQKNEQIKTYGGPEIRAGARYLISPSFSVKAGYNNAIQYIHVLTNNTTVSPIDTWKLSDLNIKPQRGQQFSLGLFKNLEANTYEISLEGFYKESQNVLDFKTGADLLLNENVETEVLQGDGRSYGAELLIRKNKGRLNGWLSYTYSRSFLKLDSPFEEERVNSGEFFPSNFDKPHDLSMVANYKFTRRFSFSANFIYQTGRPVTVPVGNISFNGANYAVYSDRNSYRIPDFYRLDLAFNIEGNHKLQKAGHSFWSVSIYNALGRNNPYSVFYVTDSGEVEAYKSSIFAIPVPSITYNLKF